MNAGLRYLLSLVACALIAPWVLANELDRLAADLAGPDEHARVVARQLLPRFGPQALDSLIPLLGHKDMAVAAAAFNVIEDITNESAAPGREADRLVSSRALMRLVAPAQPNQIKVKGLRLLPLVVAEDTDLAPIAALLADPQWREKARAALQQIRTRAASAALLDAISKADAAFACALLDALGRIQDPATVMPLGLLSGSHEDPKVRAAALRAIAWTGDPWFIGGFREAWVKATPETDVETAEAVLLLAQAMAQRGGNWDAAIALYKEILATTTNGPLKSAALMGLGRYGDETVVDTIVAAAKDPEPRLQATAVSALEALSGRAAALRILQAYPACDPAVRLRLVGAFARRHDATFLPVLQTEAASADPAFRMAALRALAESGLVDALPSLVQAAQTGAPEERAVALDGATRMAGALGTAGDQAAAGKAFLSLYNLARADELRIKALEGLARYPVADAFDAVMAALQNEPLKAAASKALPALFRPLAASGQEDKALQVFAAVTNADPSPQTLLALVSQLQGVQTKLDTTRLLGLVNSWSVAGPFKWGADTDWDTPFVGEPNVDLNATYKSGDKELHWKPVTAGDAVGTVNLMEHMGQVERQFAYAYTEIESPEAGPGQIRVGSDDGNTVWLNGTKIWENRCDRGAALDQDKVDCQIQQGLNRILVRISQIAGGWNFCLRITRPDGTAFPFMVQAGN